MEKKCHKTRNMSSQTPTCLKQNYKLSLTFTMNEMSIIKLILLKFWQPKDEKLTETQMTVFMISIMHK